MVRGSGNQMWLCVIFYLVIFSGFCLACYQIIYNRSLWVDEARLGLNIVHKSFGELLHPLDYNQVAPIGFLFAEKLLTNVFGNQDLVLRIFPFISFCISIPLFYLLSDKILPSKLFALVATALYSINLRLLYYSSELKQYSSDVMVGILIFYTALYYQSHASKKLLLFYALVGIIAVWFSNIAIILLFVCGLYSCYHRFILNKDVNVVLPILAWLVSFVLYYSLFIYHHPSKARMVNYWDGYFLPLNPFSKAFYTFIFATIHLFYSKLIKYAIAWIIPLSISLTGTIFLLKEKKYTILYFLFMPIVVHLLLSGLKLYPFAERLILYLVPLLILLFVFGLYYIWQLLKKKSFLLSSLALLLPVLVLYYPIIKEFPMEKEEVKKCLAYMAEHIEKEDQIYVYSGAFFSFNFYHDKYPALTHHQVIYGESHRDDWQQYDDEVLALKDNAWLLFSHVFPIGKMHGNEEQHIINTLTQNGYKVLAEKNCEGASIYKIAKR